MAAKKRSHKKKTAKAPKVVGTAAAYTISAPNPFYEGFYYDRKVRFIEGKARITDALAKTVQGRDGVSHSTYYFENAEELARHFMDTVGWNLDDQGQPTERSFTITPDLPALAPVIDENTPNAGRPRRLRVRNLAVMAEPPPPGVPAGADPDEVFAAPRKPRKEKEPVSV